MAWVLRSGVLRRCGILAYGLYLLHQPVNAIVHALVLRSVPTLATVPAMLLTAGSLAVTFLVAELSWQFLEQPLLALGQRLRYRGPAGAGASTPKSPIRSFRPRHLRA